MSEYTFLSLLLFGFFLIGCSPKVEATLPVENRIQTTIIPKFDCPEWQQIYDGLSDEAKVSFQKEGVYFVSGGYLLSEKLVKNCRLNIEIGKFLWKGVIEDISDTDRKFARKNSKQIVLVLQHIWNSANFSADGMHHEKYLLLLRDRGIKDQDISPFISQLLKEEGIHSPELGKESELFYLLLDRHLPSLTPNILELLAQEEKENDFTGQVYALYLLHRNTFEEKYLTKLKAIKKNTELPSGAKVILEKIINKIEKKVKINLDDFENFGYAVINNKPLFE